MDIINLTGEPILIDVGNVIIALPAIEIIARCETRRDRYGSIDDIPVSKIEYCKIVGLPAAQHETIFIVTPEVARAVRSLYPDRRDIYVVDEEVSDRYGRVVGYVGLTEA